MRPAAPPASPRQIRRYGNRKLYDPAARTYVTIDDLGAFVAGGGEIEVLDQRSGEDLTSLVLAQILLEGLRQSTARIPRQVLARLVRLATAPRTRWGEWPDPQQVAGRAWDEAEKIVGRLLARGRLSLEDALSLREDLGRTVHGLVTEAQTGAEARFRALLHHGRDDAGRSLGALHTRLDDLEAYLDNPSPPRRRRARARPVRRRGDPS